MAEKKNRREAWKGVAVEALATCYEIGYLAPQDRHGHNRCFFDGGIEVGIRHFHNFDEVALKIAGNEIVLGGKNTVTGQLQPANHSNAQRAAIIANLGRLQGIREGLVHGGNVVALERR